MNNGLLILFQKGLCLMKNFLKDEINGIEI